MVRLKASVGVNAIFLTKFQFLDGAIKSKSIDSMRIQLKISIP